MGEGRVLVAFHRAMQVNLLIEDGREDSNNHRGRLDIIADILDASVGGVKRTHLMYNCNLSFKQLKAYSHFLLKQGFLRLITQDSNNGSLEVTEKGREFLRVYEGLKSLMH